MSDNRRLVLFRHEVPGALEVHKVLPGHHNDDITTHYPPPEREELIETAYRV